jgi:glucosyl-3-phosphoglycerate synthase
VAEKLFRKIIVPMLEGCDSAISMQVAHALARGRNILLVGIIQVHPGESLSTGALPARAMRRRMREWREKLGIRTGEQIRVTDNPWKELISVVREQEPELLVFEEGHLQSLATSLEEALRYPPCSVAFIQGSLPEKCSHLLVALRGGPSAALALRVGLSIAQSQEAEISTLHLLTPGSEHEEAPYQGIELVLRNLPEVKERELVAQDPAREIVAASEDCDLLIMGATVKPITEAAGLGPIAETILGTRKRATLITKVASPAVDNEEKRLEPQSAISVLVDKWFAENTYHAEEFADLRGLLRLKEKQDLKISLALPALNEEETVGIVIKTIKHELMERVPLLDEMVLMDSNSSDRTRQIASDLGVPVYIHQELLPAYGARAGKGEALWKSLYVTHGDIVVWIDTDIVNISPNFVYGLLGPMLINPRIQFVKGYYQRPLKVDGKMQAGGGGRVTELTARPLLNLFYPELSGVIQPLSGEYGGRRAALEAVPFSSGYGVEIGLLIDLFEKHGLSALAQVDLSERIHHNQPLDSLSRMSFAIIQSVVRRLERRYQYNMLDDINKTMKQIRYEQGTLFLDVNEIAEVERPAMIDVPEYMERFKVKV